jgi:hypothetical protein
VLAAAAVSVAAASAAPSPGPSPSASAGASAKASAAAAARTAIVSCRVAPLYAWPDRTTAPYLSGYPAARLGDAFGVIGTGSLTTTGMNLSETTIDVVEPYGTGKHYWIATACIT